MAKGKKTGARYPKGKPKTRKKLAKKKVKAAPKKKAAKKKPTKKIPAPKPRTIKDRGLPYEFSVGGYQAKVYPGDKSFKVAGYTVHYETIKQIFRTMEQF